MKIIYLADGKNFVKVDDKDWHWIAQRAWQLTYDGYASSPLFGYRSKKASVVLMHRLILLAPDTLSVDHANRDKLDNQRKNLRLANTQQQMGNMAKMKGSSRYKGVHRRWDNKKWVAQIKTESGPTQTLGSFSSEIDAARAYNEAAISVFGKFALLNEVPLRRNKK